MLLREVGIPGPAFSGYFLALLRYNRQGRKANVGAGTATAAEPTREDKQYALQGPTTYLCTEREQQLGPTTSLRQST